MKRILINGLILVISVCVASWVGYTIGHQRGFELALLHGADGIYVGTLSALQKIRAGDVQGGTRRIENSCFAAAKIVYGGQPETEFIARTFLTDLRHYRQTYRTNSADWSPMEQILEGRLAAWK